ncbi:MAG: Uma2 family endonuclease [Pseudomonadota bacterium]
MNAIVNLQGVPQRLMHFDATTHFKMLEHGLFPEFSKVELVDGVLINSSEHAVGPEIEIDGVTVKLPQFTAELFFRMIDAGLFDDKKVELIDGVLIELNPAKNDYGTALAYLTSAFISQIPSDLKGSIDVAIELNDGTVVGPDLTILPKSISSDDATGTDLLLAVEIANSSLNYDLRTKANLYSVHSVPELWVVDLPNRKLHIHREPASSGYQSVTALEWNEPASPLFAPDISLTLSEIIEL